MQKEKAKAFADRVFGDMAGAMTAGLGYLGVVTGLFRTLADQGPLRQEDVARASGLQPRYVEEWLKGMTAAGYLEYDPARATYLLPEEHAYFLASDGTDHHVGGLFAMVPVLLRVAPRVAEAFVRGGGVPFEDFGPEGVSALALLNSGQYEHRLVGYWLAAVPDTVAQLEGGGRVLDVGCGSGRVVITLARAFPQATLVGVDPDAESIARATRAAREAGVENRTQFIVGTTRDVQRGAGFDLATACDCLHDFAAPLDTLREIRALLRPDGVLFVAEPKVADRLEDNRNAVATMFYGFSMFHCMTQSLARGGPGLGTCLGPVRTEQLIRAAGFGRFAPLDIKSQVNLFYAARP